MFPHQFKFQIRKEILDDAVSAHEIIVTEYTTNGNDELQTFKIRMIDLPDLIKKLEGFVRS